MSVFEPPQAFLIRESVQGPRETVHAGRVGKVGVAQGAANQVGGVGGHVSTFMVGVQHEVQAGDILEGLAVVDPKHVGVVARPIQARVGGNVLAVEVHVPEDAGGQWRDLGNEAQRVVQHVDPVVGLLHGPRSVVLLEAARGLQREQPHGELGHGVHVLGEGVDQLGGALGQRGALVQLFVQRLHLRIRRDLIGEQQPEGGLGQADLAGGAGLRQLLVALLQRPPAVANALHGVEQRGLAHQALDAPSPADAHVHRDLAERIVAVLLLQPLEDRRLLLREGLDLPLERRDDLRLCGEPAAQPRRGPRGPSAQPQRAQHPCRLSSSPRVQLCALSPSLFLQ
mmetsp:Transcript_91478/g.255462  ORF Transcript_91478/g.255462 Transcript_91478/m.255462 type:complete len:340 (+) Transcript_91478:830-1849(+)